MLSLFCVLILVGLIVKLTLDLRETRGTLLSARRVGAGLDRQLHMRSQLWRELQVEWRRLRKKDGMVCTCPQRPGNFDDDDVNAWRRACAYCRVNHLIEEHTNV